jgi:fucose 4-O-acetylase-like acetyltransferase
VVPLRSGERAVRIDAMRGAAIMCVVLGHAVQRNVGADASLFLFLAAFEMPLLALVSGYLATPTAARPLPWILARSRRLLVPFVVWAPVLWLMSRFAFTGLDVVGIPASLITYLQLLFARPSDGLWYLLVLFYWCVIALSISPLLRRPECMPAALGVCAAISMGLVLSHVAVPASFPGDFGLPYLVALLPFFLAGLALRATGRDLGAASPRALAGVGLALFVAVAWSVVSPWAVLRAVDPGLVALAQGMAGVTAAVVLIRSLPTGRWLAPLATMGRASMGVYAIHLLFLRTGVGSGWVKALTSFALASGLSLLGTWLVRKNHVTARLLLGEVPAGVPEGASR